MSGGEAVTLYPSEFASGSSLNAPTVATRAITLTLYEGATLRATRTVTPTTALGTLSFDLTAEEFAAITDWTVLRVAITADLERAFVAWVALEAPDHTVTATPISSGSELFAPSIQQQSLSVLLYEGATLRATL